ncbi:MAG: DNA mismatch repair protein MutS [Bacteroidetes bacterium]|nr:MAG: DNA mismatch repair protein MutS [Bacteroidota bacterium]
MSQNTAEKAPRGNTPLMRQYWSVKDRYPGTILLFRMGDFYETFAGDAELVHEVLGIALTKRSNGKASDVALAGFPHHAIDTYLPKLVSAGYRVAICEQLEDPKTTKNIVKRDVVEVVTPGVSLRDQLLDPRKSQYLAAVHFQNTSRSRSKRAESGTTPAAPKKSRTGKTQAAEDRVGIAYSDASTGEFVCGDVSMSQLPDFLNAIAPAELLCSNDLHPDSPGRQALKKWSSRRATTTVVTRLEDWAFGKDFANTILTNHFDVHSLKGFGVNTESLGIVAAGALLHYVSENQKTALSHIMKISRLNTDDNMILDLQTCRNLELAGSIQSGQREGSLIQLLDETVTPMGARKLRSWLLRPLNNLAQIEDRHDAVAELFESDSLRQEVRERLKSVGDLERIAGRAVVNRVSPRDLTYLKNTLQQIPDLKRVLGAAKSAILARVATSLDAIPVLEDLISRGLVDNPPAQLKDGGVIRDGFNADLDELRLMSRSGKEYLADLQSREAELTGISSLKVGYNRVFGYYLEVTHRHRDRVPSEWIRKQTLVNAERYITEELKEYEEKILSAEGKLSELEARLFHEFREAVTEQVPALQLNAELIANLDVLTSFSETAHVRKYVRPVMDDSFVLEIKNGRHPVVEAFLPDGEPFIPNDTSLDPDISQIMVITGPNMAGKSVILRQVGLIVLLAQVGAFVPADSACIGVVDRIFTRVGASDNLAAGESTFLVEMNETANILNNATPSSLILLDEVGRGTSTFDGLSIAWALVEYLHDEESVRAKTLFATHYHELNECSNRLSRVKNFRIQVHEHDGRLIFLRRLVAGAADHSYGIEVARMAGIPEPVLVRANEVLKHLESQKLKVEETMEDAGVKAGASSVPDRNTIQMSLFDGPSDPVAAEIRDRIESMNPERLTPLDALVTLSELKKLTVDSKRNES